MIFSPYVEGDYACSGKGSIGGGFRMAMPLESLFKILKMCKKCWLV